MSKIDCRLKCLSEAAIAAIALHTSVFDYGVNRSAYSQTAGENVRGHHADVGQ